MLFGDDRLEHRDTFFSVWKKMQDKENKLSFTPLEKRIQGIIEVHPEFHKYLEEPEKYADKDFLPELEEVNPFLHLSLHLVILDQIAINQPKGITKLYQDAINTFLDRHEAEHCLMNAMSIELFNIMKNNEKFDEKGYLKHIKKSIVRGHW